MCVCARAHVCAFVCLCICLQTTGVWVAAQSCLHTCTSAHMCACAHIHTHIHTYTHMREHTHRHRHRHRHTHTHMHMHMHTHMTHMRMRVHAHTHPHTCGAAENTHDRAHIDGEVIEVLWGRRHLCWRLQGCRRRWCGEDGQISRAVDLHLCVHGAFMCWGAMIGYWHYIPCCRHSQRILRNVNLVQAWCCKSLLL